MVRPSAASALLALAGVATLAGSSTPAGAQVGSGVPVRVASPEAAAQRISSDDGQVRVVLLYAATCPHSREMMPEFVRRAASYAPAGVSVLAFSTDDDDLMLESYLSHVRASTGEDQLPFDGVRLESTGSALRAALASAGVDLGKWGTPFVAVLDRAGRVVGTHSGGSGVNYLARWLRRAGADIPLDAADGPEAVVEAEAAAIAARATTAGWAVLHRNDRMEIAADTLGYTRASNPATGTAYRTLVRYGLVRRTPDVAQLWDKGARTYAYDQAVFCGLDGTTDLQVHRAVALAQDGRVVTPLVAHDADWVTPRPGSPDATLARALCRLLGRADRAR